MGADTPEKLSNDELKKIYEKIQFPSGDLDDLIFSKVELKDSDR